MAAVPDGVTSSGSTNRGRAGQLPPLPCTGDPTEAYSVSPSSSASRFEASRAAAFHAADAKPKPDDEASAAAGKSGNMPLAVSSTGGRGRCGSRPASDSAGPLNHHRPASPSPCIRGGDDYGEPHGGEDASSSVTGRLEKGNGRSPDRADLMKPIATLQNIILHPSLLYKRGAVSDRRFHNSRGKDNEVYDQNWQTEPVSSIVSSAREWSLESDGTFEGSNHKPSATPQNIRLQTPRLPLLDKRVDRIDMCGACSSENYHQHVGALDAINEWRLPKSCVVITKCPRKSSFTTSSSRKFSPGPLGKVKDKSVIARSVSAQYTSSSTASPTKKEAYVTTLGAGGGYGYPHPPPFYKCQACRKGTAFYMLKCCRRVVCQRCGCACEPGEAVEDDMVQSRRGKVLAVKEKLPKVKLEGSDLFLWQPCSFPADLMLCMAKRTGNHLQYYFAEIEDLMNPGEEDIEATVYDFRQHGRNVTSLSVRKELLMRNQLW